MDIGNRGSLFHTAHNCIASISTKCTDNAVSIVLYNAIMGGMIASGSGYER